MQLPIIDGVRPASEARPSQRVNINVDKYQGRNSLHPCERLYRRNEVLDGFSILILLLLFYQQAQDKKPSSNKLLSDSCSYGLT